MRRYGLVVASVVLFGLFGVGIVWAHAALLRANPAPNSVIAEPPDEIRLWFTEPLEPAFSYIRLRDANGNAVETPPSTVDSNDLYQMSLVPDNLPDGLYTVNWQALSAADGHQTIGSFPLTIGAAVAGSSGAQGASDDSAVPVERAVIRWANLFSLALAVGSVSFRLFVWNQAIHEPQPASEKRMDRLTWLGWLLVGIAGVLLLFMQASVALGQPLFASVNGQTLGRIIAETRFGQVWLVRMALWVGLGGALLFTRSDAWFRGVALVLGLMLLATNSLFSHANSGAGALPSVAADYLHLAATALWFGGLVMFASVVGPVRRAFPSPATTLSTLVGYFTNFARAAVVILIITGLYAAWLQVGSIEGLVTTTYGQALLVKLVLILPLIGIAGVNLLFTSRGLQAGQDIWAGRLRNLIGTEIALILGVFAAIGVMTSISPARTVLNQRALMPTAPPDNTLIMTQEEDDLTIQLEITPGWIGENTFTMTIADEDGNPVADASLIRMRFTAQGIGESELRPVNLGDGAYATIGSNLSVTGEWRIRSTIQRPDEFDTLVDFEPLMDAAPIVPLPPRPNPNEPLPNRVPALLLTGVLCLGAAGFFLAENWRSLRRGAALLGGGLAVVALVFLFSGAQALRTTPVAAAQDTGYQPADNEPVRLAASPSLPYLVTAGGEILQPEGDGTWNLLNLDAHVNDLYLDAANTLWAATDSGLRAYRDGAWQTMNDAPAKRLHQSHGYLFALGEQTTRAPMMLQSLEQSRPLALPLADQATTDFVMLGNHSHVIQNGDQVYVTGDLGLSWESLNAPVPIRTLGEDTNGNLLAGTNDGVLRYSYTERTWGSVYPLPEGQPIDVLRDLNDTLFALAGGKLYRLDGRTWNRVALPDANVNFLTAMTVQYPGTLWVLDGPGRLLWSSSDGRDWTLTAVEVTGA